MLAGPQRAHLEEILLKMKAQNQNQEASTPPGLPTDHSPLVDEVDPPNPWGKTGNNIPIRKIQPPNEGHFNRGSAPSIPPPRPNIEIQPPQPNIWNVAPVPVPSPANTREPFNRDR